MQAFFQATVWLKVSDALLIECVTTFIKEDVSLSWPDAELQSKDKFWLVFGANRLSIRLASAAVLLFIM